MGVALCFRHKKRDCQCIAASDAVEYTPASKLVKRKVALEIFYSCRAFAQNIVYKPEAMAHLAQQYVTVADALAETTTDPVVAKMLKEAGFAERGEASIDKGPSNA